MDDLVEIPFSNRPVGLLMANLGKHSPEVIIILTSI